MVFIIITNNFNTHKKRAVHSDFKNLYEQAFYSFLERIIEIKSQKPSTAAIP